MNKKEQPGGRLSLGVKGSPRLGSKVSQGKLFSKIKEISTEFILCPFIMLAMECSFTRVFILFFGTNIHI